ncbi:hypothetical protein FFLO_06473 [Filobasidium floriforme]|uniref:Endoplasmic reticulum transmembrane protein n=1 Tax=Filobasidium floriforme TaxID=5210 RepID=A0A8K0JFB0_9TREE|nr:hypothetical protein FFLO_06473 [Filobasidium floriforme]
MPFVMKKKMMHFLSENPIVAKIQYGNLDPFSFVAVLFVDAVQRMIKVAQEGQVAKEEKGVQDIRAETNHHARKFYAQRNLYLTGATLFLAVLLTRVFAIVLDLINSQEQLNQLKTNTSKTAVAAGPNKALQTEVVTLKEQLAAKDRDLAALKKQAGQNVSAFNELADSKQPQSLANKKVA